MGAGAVFARRRTWLFWLPHADGPTMSIAEARGSLVSSDTLFTDALR
jgi:hypothetical protein